VLCVDPTRTERSRWHEMGVLPPEMKGNKKENLSVVLAPNSGLVMNSDASRLLGKPSHGMCVLMRLGGQRHWSS